MPFEREYRKAKAEASGRCGESYEYGVGNGDGHGANERAYAGWQASDEEQAILKNICGAHIVANVSGADLKIADGFVSGVIAFGLANAGADNFTFYKRAFRDELLLRSHVVCGLGLNSCVPQLRALFDALIDGTTENGLKRKHVLTRNLNGHIGPTVVTWHKDGGTATNAELFTWAEEIVDAACPMKPGTFSRTRWLDSTIQFRNIALSANLVDGMFKSLVQRWRRYLTFKEIPFQQCSFQYGGRATSEFDLSDTESEVDESDAKPGVNWPAWNRMQRRDTMRWGKDKCIGQVSFILDRCLKPLVTLLRDIQYVSSRKWWDEQMKKAIGGQALTRVEDAASLRSVTQFHLDADSILFADVSSWLALHRSTIHLQNVAFSLLSRAKCGIEQNLGALYRGLPVALFRLIKEPGMPRPSQGIRKVSP